MVEFLTALRFNPILFYSLLAGFFASIVSGIMGSYVVVKRIVFIAGSISHSVLGGIGICLYLQKAQGWEGANPLVGALIAGVISALLIGWIRLYYRQREDSVIAALWACGMAIGILFISQTPGFNVELTNFLIGNILWVTPTDLYILGAMDVATVVLILILHKRFAAICFDEEQAELQGVPVKSLYMLLLVLIAISVVLLIQVVGIVLVLAMLTIPPAMANLMTYRFSFMMFWAIIISMVLSFAGSFLAYTLDWPPGGTIALLAGLAYIAALWIRTISYRLSLTKLYP